jgi:hypothetical protein
MRLRTSLEFLLAAALAAQTTAPPPSPAKKPPVEEEQGEDYRRTRRPVEAKPDPRDPGKPVLKRGAARKLPPDSPDQDDPAAPVTPAQPAQPAERHPTMREMVTGRSESGEGATRRPLGHYPDELVADAAEAAFEFSETLPNFICDQLTYRSQSETRSPNWKLHDRVQVELAYFEGKEDYRNIRVNGKPLKKGSPMESGTWSTGEFGTVLQDIYAANSQARFKLRSDSQAAGLKAKVYDFQVEQPNSHWRIQLERTVYPEYTGSVWIDPESKRTLRIEMQARRMPGDVRWNHLEMAIDYGWALIAGKRYLLPVKSENVACVRGTFTCTKNEIEFRNYRRFGAESKVLTVDSDVSYPEEKAPPKKQ